MSHRAALATMIGAAAIAAGVAGVGLARPAPGSAANPIRARAVAGPHAFGPAVVRVRDTAHGVVVHFTSADGLPHNATPVRRIRGARTLTSTRGFTLSLPKGVRGTIAYHCTIHPFMHGTLIVR